MTPGQPACGQPPAPQHSVAGDRLERVLRARRMEAAARRKHRRDGDLVAAYQLGESPARERREGGHGSPGLQHRPPPGEKILSERGKRCGIGLAPGADHEIPGRLVLLQLAPPDLADPPAQTIAGHRGRLVSRYDQSHPWVARQIVCPDHLQMSDSATPACGEAAADVGGACEPVGPRNPRRRRQDPPCFEGSDTVSCFRPFFRRRDSTARPHRVAIRARNPCLLIRRLLRGR